MQSFLIIHSNKILLNKNYNRIFFLYKKIKSFLLNYWQLKFAYVFIKPIWKINDKVFVFLFKPNLILGKIFIKQTATNFIVTFTDLFGKVIYCATSFSSLEQNKKDKIEDYLSLQ